MKPLPTSPAAPHFAAALEIPVASARTRPIRFALSDGFIVGLGHRLRMQKNFFQSLSCTSATTVRARLPGDPGLMPFAPEHRDVMQRAPKACCAAKISTT